MNTLQESKRRSGVSATGKRLETAESILRLKSILVPMDFSKISQKALDYAVPLAKQFGAKITVLHAIEPPPYRSTRPISPGAMDSRSDESRKHWVLWRRRQSVHAF